ncbi:response regulator transcription factor [Caballeronia sp. dw_19]|uniref:response regulator transcription factor n=1 Tax=Caballeronia sp. dw_19 TaxID=2719791 RepID=UPI001BD62686|nr:response regulator transcription factor [Caballeronia sp. dw_19]
MKRLILIVDSDPTCRDVLRTSLQTDGYDVAVLYDASKVARRIEEERPALILMASGSSERGSLPALRALQALRIAQDDLPVIMIGNRDDVTERIVALECGADDFISKPFNVHEVLLRIGTVLRRVGQHHFQDPTYRKPFLFSGFKLDYGLRSLTYLDDPVSLTQHEYAILALFSTAPGRVFSKAAIAQSMHSDASSARTNVGVWVHRLRERIKLIVGACEFIETFRGHGYVFHPDRQPTPQRRRVDAEPSAASQRNAR